MINKKRYFLLSIIICFSLIFSACSPEIPGQAALEKPEEAETDSKSNSELLEIHYLDIGQGDAILLKLPRGEAMLIDAGDYSQRSMLESYLRAQGIEKIDVLIATHPHADHIGGMAMIVDSFAIGSVFMPDATNNTRSFEELLLAIERKGLEIEISEPSKHFLGDLEWEILHPDKEEYDSLNDYSVVVKATWGKRSFLFTGDAEKLAEERIVRRAKGNLEVDVLKVAHHGSRSSTSADFLREANPTYAVISCGADNRYGHPHPEIMKALLKKGITVLRTDELGTIIFFTDGEQLFFRTKKEPNNKTELDDERGISETKESVIASDKGVIIESIDKIGEIAVLYNSTEEKISMSGWVLLSVRGNQAFVFPEGAEIAGGERITVSSSGNDDGDFLWGEGNIWNNKESDPGVLYNALGEEIYYFAD